MKELKNDCISYVNQVMESINSCYKTNAPSDAQLMELYSFIGKCICEEGEKAFVVYLADLLTSQLPQLKGFSPRNLRRMRDFYTAYKCEPKLMKKTQALTWTQNTVVLECCENNEQRSFYLNLAKKHTLSKLALMKAIKEGYFEQAFVQNEIPETASDCCHAVGDLWDTEGSNTTAPAKNDCRAFVPRCVPFHQGVGAPKTMDRAFRYLYRLKIDFILCKMIYYEKASLGVRLFAKRLRQNFRFALHPPDLAEQNQMPILLLT